MCIKGEGGSRVDRKEPAFLEMNPVTGKQAESDANGGTQAGRKTERRVDG